MVLFILSVKNGRGHLGCISGKDPILRIFPCFSLQWRKAATSDWASKSCRCLPKGGTWRAAAEVLVCSESISHLYCSGQVLGSDSGGRNWDHCLKRLRLSVEMQEIILEEAEWRSSTGAKLGQEGERKNKGSHSPQSPESPGWWANTIYSFFPSR